MIQLLFPSPCLQRKAAELHAEGVLFNGGRPQDYVPAKVAGKKRKAAKADPAAPGTSAAAEAEAAECEESSDEEPEAYASSDSSDESDGDRGVDAVVRRIMAGCTTRSGRATAAPNRLDA